MQVDNKNRFSLLYFLMLLSILLLIHALFFRQKVDELSYAKFKEMAEQPYRIEKCTVSTTHITGVYISDEKIWDEVKKRKLEQGSAQATPKEKEGVFPFSGMFEEKKGRTRFVTVRVHDDPDLVKMLEKNNIPFQGEVDSNWLTMLLSWLLPIGLIIVLWVIFMRRMNNYGRDVMSFGKSRAKISVEQDTKTTFADVAGCNEAKEELQEIVEFLKSPQKFEQLGGKIPRGALLVGPPGTGKTLLARAVAGEAGVPFYHISGSEFVEMFVGVGASRVRDLFQQAKSKPPCIVFIDEIDAVGRHRGAGLGGGHDEREQTLNQLLSEMDGFEVNRGIIVLAATNRPDILDPALLRPGRFDRRIVIDRPDIRGREEILQIHSKNKPLSPEIDLKQLAQRTVSFSGADLANVMNEAALLAARKNKKQIDQDDIAEAIERVVMGPERRSRLISLKEKRMTAFHEVGHAMVAELHPNGDHVHTITIIPRGAALGYVLHMPDEDNYSQTREELLSKICVSLAGRVAEEICCGSITTGAQQDLEHVTDLARSMVARFGMSKRLGPLAFEKDDGYVFLGKNFDRKSYFSGSTLDKIDQEVREIVMRCYQQTIALLLKHKSVLEKLAEIMLERERMEGEEFRQLLHSLIAGNGAAASKQEIQKA
jgi:cell division protease FtsH